MKSLYLPIFLLLAVQHVTAQSEQETRRDLKHITIDQLDELIDLRSVDYPPSEIVGEVFSSGRMDLIAKCFEKPGTIFWVQERLGKLQDSPTRDQIVITMLRSTSPYLPSIPNPEKAAIRKGPIAPWPIEPFRSVIKKWLPNEPLEPAVMNTPEARAVLADKLEAAIAGLPAPESKPLKTTKQGQPRSQSAPGTQEVSGASVAVAPPAPSPQSPSGYRWWWILGLFGLGVSLLLLRWARRV